MVDNPLARSGGPMARHALSRQQLLVSIVVDDNLVIVSSTCSIMYVCSYMY
jgi:hypothetical protein